MGCGVGRGRVTHGLRHGTPPSADEMPHTLIDDPQGLDPLQRSLDGARRLALDCEAAGFHRYSDRLCLLQLSFEDVHFLVDPLAFDPGPVVRATLEDPEVEIVMHGSDYDLRLLDRDLGIRPRRIFDTQVAASLLGEPALGLSALLERHVGVTLSKKYQRADWALRPLPDDMLSYAVSDTLHLMELADLLRDALDEKGRRSWAEEEFEALEEIRHEPSQVADLATRVKGARHLSPRELERLRALLEWRDEVARALDRAPFRVADDRTLSTIAQEPPRSVRELGAVRGFSTGLARERGEEVLDRLDRADRIPEVDLRPYPRSRRNGPGRPPPEVEARLDRIKEARNERATELGLDRGTLLPNAGLTDIAMNPPRDLDELRRRGTVRRWQVEAAGEAILEALVRT